MAGRGYPLTATRPASGEVHIWQATLALSTSELLLCEQTLSEAEVDRANRFLAPDKRCNFMAARSFLRTTLAPYLDLEPKQIEFSYGLHGKPRLLLEKPGDGLQFNLSHSGGLALLAITSDCKVGIDLEQVVDDFPCREIARRFFSPPEIEAIMTLPDHLQISAFYRCWTRKEAYIKGVGTGFSLPPHCFTVSLLPEEPPALLGHQLSPEETCRWNMADVPTADGYCAAVAVRGSAPNLVPQPPSRVFPARPNVHLPGKKRSISLL